MGKWNHMKIKVVGSSVITWLNGTKMVELEDKRLVKEKEQLLFKFTMGVESKLDGKILELKNWNSRLPFSVNALNVYIKVYIFFLKHKINSF